MSKKSTNQKQKDYVQRMKAAQYKQMAPWLPPEIIKKIEDLMKAENLTQAQAITKLINE